MAISTLQMFRQGVNGMLDQQNALLKTQLAIIHGESVCKILPMIQLPLLVSLV